MSHNDSTDTVAHTGLRKERPDGCEEPESKFRRLEDGRKSNVPQRDDPTMTEPPVASERMDPASIVPSFTAEQRAVYEQVGEDDPQLYVHIFPSSSGALAAAAVASNVGVPADRFLWTVPADANSVGNDIITFIANHNGAARPHNGNLIGPCTVQQFSMIFANVIRLCGLEPAFTAAYATLPAGTGIGELFEIHNKNAQALGIPQPPWF